ncbi:hypothetical protein [Neomoorella thermoacetica]|uniref:hypothetical protein n=1 Tax=Neomoorella thermoacetica TaxID=1525 RepID=UPI0008FA4E35|nr:hypothetical protein [Moorella thermoacetica]OIQ10502.1 hypothetical protein MOOTH_25760 [Moorella thermoacetica]
MFFYAGRISLIPSDSLYYVEGKENKLELVEKALMQSFIYPEKYGVNIIHEPIIHPDYGLIGGYIGRQTITKIPKYESNKFKKFEDVVYPYVHYFYLKHEQVIVVERNTSVFKKEEKVFEYLSNYLNNNILYPEGLVVYIKPLTEKGEFWKSLKELGEVHEIHLRFIMPNFLGQAYSNIRELLLSIKSQTRADEVEQSFYSAVGKASIPKDDKFESAIGWIEDGGGEWRLVRKSMGGKTRKVISNRQKLTLIEQKELVLDNLTTDDLVKIIKKLNLGLHSIINKSKGV